MGGSAALLSASSFFSGRTVGDLILYAVIILVALFGAIARFVYIVKHRNNPGVGFTQRRRYQNEVRARREHTERLAQAAAVSPEDDERPLA
jgi:hypothetical protein